MGDRANIQMLNEEDKSVYLYTHWRGSELPGILQRALAKRWRWNDDAYLARIIFCEMVKGSETGETGFGISASLGDGDDRILIVDARWGRVQVAGRGAGWSFEEYLKINPETVW